MNILQQITCNKEFIIILRQLLLIILFYFLFIFPINSVWFNINISLFVGNIYYWLNETHPYLLMFINIAVRSFFQKTQNEINTFISRIWKKENNKNRLREENNYNFIEYYDILNFKHKKYIFSFHQKYRSNDLIIFKDEFDKDITDLIEPYLGPMQNFHGVPLTPADFNHKQITIFRDGEICISKTFKENEPLKMN